MKKILLGLLLAVIAISILGYFWFQSITNKIFIHASKSSSVTVDSVQQSLIDKKPINILLLGYGGGNHDGAYLTDSMMVVHIDPKQQKTTLISIPRDIWIKIPTNGTDGSYAKINAAYEYGLDTTSFPGKQDQFKGADGGGHMAEYVVSQVTGLPISYFVGMDFSGFTHTIDTLGGVDINVETAFDDYEYPIDGKEADLCGQPQSAIPTLDAQATQSAVEMVYPCRYQHLHFDKGLTHMDGVRALTYVRSRHSLQDGTDFGRAKRQRNLIIAVKQKVLSAGFIPKIIPFISSLGDDLRTDLTIDDIKSLLQNSSDLSKYPVTTLAITDQNYLIDSFSADGQSILQSKDGVDSWTSVHTWIADTLSGKTIPVTPVIEVENGTHTPGLALTATNKLKAMNLQTVDPANAPDTHAQTKIIIYAPNINPSDLNAIKNEFSVTTVSKEQPTQNVYNVLVIVGDDYSSTTPTK